MISLKLLLAAQVVALSLSGGGSGGGGGGVVNAYITGTCEGNTALCGNYSVARVVENDNLALGDFCTVGGGKGNMAGGGEGNGMDDPLHKYAVVGGGYGNMCRSRKAVISGGYKNIIPSNPRNVEKNQYCTISGGKENNNNPNATGEFYTISSVITGGYRNTWKGKSRNPQMVISGGSENSVDGRQSVVTGGSRNVASGANSVVLGGADNTASGDFSAIPGGQYNIAAGSHSVAMGLRAEALHDHSMVINLQGNKDPVASTEEGQFLVQAKQYRLQLTNNPGKNDENVIVITHNNVQNLVDAIAAQSGRRRELRPHIVQHSKEIRERRERKLKEAQELEQQQR